VKVREYVIDKQIRKLLFYRHVKLECYTCGRRIKLGDRVVSKRANGKVKLRHYECARRIGLVD